MNESGICIYYKFDNNICINHMCLCRGLTYIFGSNIYDVNIVKSLLSNYFNIKDLREVNIIFGIKIVD